MVTQVATAGYHDQLLGPDWARTQLTLPTASTIRHLGGESPELEAGAVSSESGGGMRESQV